MYAASIVDAKLNAIQAARLPSGKPLLDFELQRHSYEEIQRNISSLADLIPDDAPPWNERKKPVHLIRQPTPDEIQFIRNERAICFADFRYWASNYAKIVFDEKLIPLRFNVAQEITLDIWAEMEVAGREIAELALKARQLGKSTVCEANVAYRTTLHPRVNSVVASSQPDQSSKMSRMMELIFENLPWYLMPACDRYNTGHLIGFGLLRSIISIQHGSQFTGLSRGDTPTTAHLSEVSEYVDPEELIDASLLNCMHPSPNIFIVLESTAKGLNNWFHRTWNDSVAGYADGLARLRPSFLPWFVGRDLYPTPTWLKTRPVPKDWIPATITVKHADRAKAYVRSNDILRKHLGANWEMPREQMWYWEVRRAEAVRKKILAQFLSEMPADANEAFQSTNISCFDVEIVAEHRERAKPTVEVYAIDGDDNEIPIRLKAQHRDLLTKDQQADRGITQKDIRADWNPMENPHDYVLRPLRFDGWTNFDPMGKLLIWEHPEPEEEYAIGVDTSDGIGADRSVIEVVRKGTIFRNDAQVAEYANPYVNSMDLWPLVLALATYYSVFRQGKRRQAKVVIECKGNGETTQLEVKKRGWAHFHQWVRYDTKKIREAGAHKIGWVTNSWSRPMMMDFLIKALRDMWLDINSPFFINEMVSLSKDEYSQSLRADYGGHDDRIMALGIPFFSLHALRLFTRGRSISDERIEYERMLKEYPQYPGHLSNAGVPNFRKTSAEVVDIAGQKWDKH